MVMMMCAMAAMAVNLPSKVYNEYSSMGQTMSYTLGTGTTYVNQSLVGAYSGECSGKLANASNGAEYGTVCPDCCARELCEGLSASDCQTKLIITGQIELWGECMDACEGQYLPLDAPTAFLLALIAAYGAVAVYRRKMQQA